MPVRLHHAASRQSRRASCCSATSRSRPARGAACSSCSNVRSRRRRTTASCCATPPRSAPSAADASSTCARRRASAARRSASRSSTRMRSTTRGRALAALLDRAPWYVDLAVFARDRALGQHPSIDAIGGARRRDRASPGTALGLSPAVWLRLKRALLATLEPSTRTIPICPASGSERLRLQLEPRLPAPAFLRDAASARARERDRARRRLGAAAGARRCGSRRPTKSSGAEIQPMLGAAERFRPPRVRDIAVAIAAPRGGHPPPAQAARPHGQGRRGGAGSFLPARTPSPKWSRSRPTSRRRPRSGQFTAAQFRDRLDNGRKVAIQILEFFDRHGVTLRRGDLRRINRQRLDLFRAVRREDASSGRETSPVGRPDFKSGRGREPVLGGFDSLSLPPRSRIEPDR